MCTNEKKILIAHYHLLHFYDDAFVDHTFNSWFKKIMHMCSTTNSTYMCIFVYIHAVN